MTQNVKKVCIIGAGPFGLMTARHLTQCPDTEVTVFEANQDIGGLWVYDEKNESDPKFEREKRSDNYYRLYKHFHASLYPYLQTNLPYFFMAFKDLSHADINPDTPVFINIDQHKAYIDAYADKFNLRKNITLNTLVKSVRLYDNLSPEMQAKVPEKRKFAVTATSARGKDFDSDEKVYAFDYVAVCTGHNSKPHIPKIEGIENFKGKVISAKDFREPTAEHLVNKRILVLGASYSAIDMAVQLFDNPFVGTENIEQMTLVGRNVKSMQTCSDFLKYRESGKLHVVEGEIKEVVGENTIKLSDGSEHEVDTLILCTGYKLNFPFLDFETDKFVDYNSDAFRGKIIAPIYKRFICIREPNLFFIGLLEYSAISSFCAESQAMLAKAIIEGKYKLPSQNEMVQSFLNDVNDIQWNYGKSMAYFFKMIPMKLDIQYLGKLRAILQEIYPHNKEKSRTFDESLLNTYKKIFEFFSSSDFLSYKKYDFHGTFLKTLRNTTEFM